MEGVFLDLFSGSGSLAIEATSRACRLLPAGKRSSGTGCYSGKYQDKSEKQFQLFEDGCNAYWDTIDRSIWLGAFRSALYKEQIVLLPSVRCKGLEGRSYVGLWWIRLWTCWRNFKLWDLQKTYGISIDRLRASLDRKLVKGMLWQRLSRRWGLFGSGYRWAYGYYCQSQQALLMSSILDYFFIIKISRASGTLRLASVSWRGCSRFSHVKVITAHDSLAADVARDLGWLSIR